MLEHADGSEMCISVMSLILKSLGVVSAIGRVAELCRSRLGGAAVDVGFERGLVVDQVTGWMIDVGQQRLPAAEQRVSPTGWQPSVATRVEAAQEGLTEAMRQVLAASITSEASVACDADMVEKDQMGGEKPVSS